MAGQFLLTQQAKHEIYGLLGAITFIIAIVIMFIILITYGYNLYVDFGTTERKSVSHRRSAPIINITYKLINGLTFLAVFIYFILISIGFIGFYSTTNYQCDLMLTWIFVTYQFAKTTTYLIYLARLYIIYEPNAAFSYPVRCIRFFVILLIIVTVAAVSALIAITVAVNNDYGDDAFPNLCLPGESFINVFVSVLLFVEEVGVAIGFLWAFMLPLRKTVKLLDSKNKKMTGLNVKQSRKILYTGTKVMILTSVATFSTVFVTIIIVITGIGYLAVPDVIISSICIILMTPYFPDIKYYKNLCCCCIKCCDKRTINIIDDVNKLEENLQAEQSQNPSVDTMSQLRVIGGKISVNYQYLSDNKQMVQVASQPDAQIEEAI